MVRAAALATAATALVLGSASVAAAAQASAAPTWPPCADVPTIGSATLRVPSTGETRHGATVELALARHNATDPSKRIGPLLVNPGGPGGSDVDFVNQADDPQGYGAGTLPADLRARFGIVAWDPRSEAETDRFLSLVEADISQGRWIAPSAGRTTVAE